MKFDRNIFQVNRVNMHQLREYGFDMTLYVQYAAGISCRKVLPSGECARSVCPAHMQQRLSASDP